VHLKIITFQNWKESMEKFKVRVVNSGLVGEPHHYCFQSLETNKKIEFSQIERVLTEGEVIAVEIEDSDIANPYISDVLNTYGHIIDLRHIDDGGYEIIF
jgi:hypothetical protein